MIISPMSRAVAESKKILHRAEQAVRQPAEPTAATVNDLMDAVRGLQQLVQKEPR
jgi:hypothetical protein